MRAIRYKMQITTSIKDTNLSASATVEGICPCDIDSKYLIANKLLACVPDIFVDVNTSGMINQPSLLASLHYGIGCLCEKNRETTKYVQLDTCEIVRDKYNITYKISAKIINIK